MRASRLTYIHEKITFGKIKEGIVAAGGYGKEANKVELYSNETWIEQPSPIPEDHLNVFAIYSTVTYENVIFFFGELNSAEVICFFASFSFNYLKQLYELNLD